MMHCPITYECINAEESYSAHGLRLLSPQLRELSPLDFSASEQRQEAIDRVGKMSIQGVQKKLSAKLKVKAGSFEIVDKKGQYILKPQSDDFLELPENEAITMSLAATIGLEVPAHGLLYCKDGSMTYFIKRFDRYGHNKKLAVEDFAQLSGGGRDTKYNSSMEKVVQVINQFCSFPAIERVKLFKLTLFNFLTGNEDMHLKNFSLITRKQQVSLSPVYDLLNSTIALKNAKEELALPLRGRKNNLTQRDLLKYFAIEQLGLNQSIIDDVLHDIDVTLATWRSLLEASFMSDEMGDKYQTLLKERCARLAIG